MIYGATGYSGRLISREAARRGMKPVLAARNEKALAALGAELGLQTRAFGLDDAERGVEGMKAVLHCAGPFTATHRPMFAACLKARAHYLDITGELPVFERVQAKRKALLAAGVAAIPGVGFDVVPTDCLAAMLKARLPDADRLTLGIKIQGKVSRGSAKTLIQAMAAGGVVRRGGALVMVPFAAQTRRIDFGDGGPERCVQMPWADVSTAYRSTGVPNIEVFYAASPAAYFLFRSAAAKSLLATGWGKALARRAIETFFDEETEAGRAAGYCVAWGEVSNAAGRTVRMRARTPEGYVLTADAALAATARVLEGRVEPGPWTPAQAFGPDFLRELKGVTIEDAAG